MAPAEPELTGTLRRSTVPAMKDRNEALEFDIRMGLKKAGERDETQRAIKAKKTENRCNGAARREIGTGVPGGCSPYSRV